MSDKNVDPVKVEFKEKKKFDYFIIVKWLLGIYFIGIMLSFNSYLLTHVAEFVYAKIMPSTFMTIELVKFAEILREPLFPLAIIIPFFAPAGIMLLLLNLLLNKVNIFPGIQKKVYMVIVTVLMLVISTSAFLFA